MGQSAGCLGHADVGAASGPKGDAPRVGTSTTEACAIAQAILASPTTVVTRARTVDNAANLDASTLAYLKDKDGGTRLAARNSMASLLERRRGRIHGPEADMHAASDAVTRQITCNALWF